MLHERPQVDRHEVGAVDAHSVITAEGFEADEQEIQHLREGQRDHDEIDSRRPQRQEADHQPHGPADGKADHRVRPAIVKSVELADADTIGPDADKGGMAEGHHPAISQNKVQPHRGHSKQHNPHRQIVPKGKIGDPSINREQRESR